MCHSFRAGLWHTYVSASNAFQREHSKAVSQDVPWISSRKDFYLCHLWHVGFVNKLEFSLPCFVIGSCDLGLEPFCPSVKRHLFMCCLEYWSLLARGCTVDVTSQHSLFCPPLPWFKQLGWEILFFSHSRFLPVKEASLSFCFLHQPNVKNLLVSVMDFLHKIDVASFGIMSSKSKILFNWNLCI